MSDPLKETPELIAAAQFLASPTHKSEGHIVAVVPNGFRLEKVDVEQFLASPLRIKQRTVHRSLDSFLAYLDRYSDSETVIFADVDKDIPELSAVIDYHAKSSASWGTHVATYLCSKTPEWETWGGSTGKPMSQVEFALFIENNAPDIVEPRSADMLLVARSITAKKNIDFHSDIRLDNGQVQFKYSETVQGNVQQGTVEIPERFKIQIPIFKGSEVYELEARFRYRIGEGGVLKLAYDLWRAHKVTEAATKRVIVQINAKFPKMPVYIGTK